MGAEAAILHSFQRREHRATRGESVPAPEFESRSESRDFFVQNPLDRGQHTETYAMMSPPRITMQSLMPERSKFTVKRILQTLVLIPLCFGFAGVGAVLMVKAFTGVADNMLYTAWMANVFGFGVFTDVAPEVWGAIAGSTIGACVTFVIAMAAIAKSWSRGSQFIDKEWYG